MGKISTTDAISNGDLAVFWKQTDCDYRGVPLDVLLAYLNANLSLPNQDFTTQYASPNGSGFSVAISDGNIPVVANVHLILTPVTGYAAGTIVLPATPGAVDKQEVLVNCTQAVTTLTVNGNGASAVIGAPTTLAANAFFRLKYDLLTKNWYRIG